MANLTFTEKRNFERLLGMTSGYVLDFSNRTFAEFITDCTRLNIYDSRYDHGSGSKANRLRKFWEVETNRVVAKLMDAMLDYGFPAGVRRSASDTALEQECRQIVTRLTHDGHIVEKQTEAQLKEQAGRQRRSEALARMKEEFLHLAMENDRSKAGLALEGLLNRLFELFELRPRSAFRVIGEQIDGSFELGDQIYLLESKWEKQALPAADLFVFGAKIEGKSTFTRGVFIALNDISGPAREAITRGKAPSFFVMNGHDLLMVLGEAMTLTDFLRQRVRLLAEEGRVCVPFSELSA